MGILAPLIGFVVIFQCLNHAFLSPNSDIAMLCAIAFVGIIAIGQTCLMVSGGIDLSVGSVAGLCAIASSWLMKNAEWSAEAGVAAGLFPMALGTDTGGSVRNPASCCGIVGLKPTYGLVSRRGVYPLSFTLDHVGPMTRTVEDNALMLEAIAGHDPQSPRASAHCPRR